MVRLKVDARLNYYTLPASFNSTMVRLKDFDRLDINGNPIRFNSTMVRLKVYYNAEAEMNSQVSIPQWSD